MNKRVKRMWINRLISGKYKQGDGVLCEVNPDPNKPDKFCCLGVLCDLAVEKGIIAPPTIAVGSANYDGDDRLLPKSVQKWAGLDGSDPALRLDDKDTVKYNVSRYGLTGLAELNDSGVKFKTIARLIEKYL
jgi:hypothetical protein